MTTDTPPKVEPDDSLRIMRSAGSGVTLQYPDLATLARVAAEVGMPCPFESEDEFLAARKAELIEYVEEPCRPLMLKLWEDGMSPYASNAFGPGQRGVWFVTTDNREGYFPLP